MNLLVFTVYDKAVKAYMQPFYARSRGEAVRSFIETCNDEKHQFSRFSADYVMFCLGEFDDGSGLFTCGEPERIISAAECIDDNVTPLRKSAG